MIIILSPSKTSEIQSFKTKEVSQPIFLSKAQELMEILQSKTEKEIKTLMSLSDNLTSHTFELIKNLSIDDTTSDTRCAIYNFKGEVYAGLNAKSLSALDLKYAQKYLVILSGLYGVLRPKDAMKMYRLEMGTRLKTHKGTNLYHFWASTITDEINNIIQTTKSKYLLNLASDEYFKSIQINDVQAKIIHIDFFDLKDGKRSFNSFNAKGARGLMAAYVIKSKITNPAQLIGFNIEGYMYDITTSDDSTYVFLRNVV